VKKGQNFNHPCKGSRIKIEPIREIESVEKIKRYLIENPRNLALFTLGTNTYLRPVDLLNIRIGQVLGIDSAGKIKITERKTEKIRTVILNRACVETVNALLHFRKNQEKRTLDSGDFLFLGRGGPLLTPSMNSLVKKWCARINLPGNYGSHTLRKTFGYQQLIYYGSDLTEIMEFLNHSNKYQTFEYLGIDPEELSRISFNGKRKKQETTSERSEKKLNELEWENAKLKEKVKELEARSEQLNIIIENSKDAIVLIDDKGYFSDATESSMEFSGITREELKGKHFSEVGFMSEETAQKCIELMKGGPQGKPARKMEFKGTRKDGTSLIIEVNPKTIKRDGAIIGYLAIIRDTTKRKNAEKDLQEKEEMARALLNATTDAVVMLLDPEGCVLEINKEYTDVFWLRKDDIKGRKLWDLLPETLLGTTKKVTAQVFESGKSVRMVKEYKGIWYDNVVSPVFDTYGNVARVAIFSHDITSMKQAEDVLLKHKDHLEELVKERTATLEESNTALKVLLKKGDEVKQEIEDKIQFNIKELIYPYLEKINKSRLDDHQKTYLDIIGSNLNNIISPFMHGISTRYLKITPKEIQIANLIRQGKTSKEIAQLLNMSPRTIDTHRYNIRTKIGLKNKKANLRTYLLSSN
jgi:PAS domain S-box-containing protein